MNTDTYEAEIRARLAAAQTDGDKLEIACEMLREVMAQSRRAQAMAEAAYDNSVRAIEAGERLAVEMQRITDALKTSVAFIADDEEVLRFQLDMDPHRIMALLLRAVEKCRSLVLADTAAPRTVQ